MQPLHYSNIAIDGAENWRARVLEYTEGLSVGFRLVKKTRSGNWIVQISSVKPSELATALDRAISA